MTDEERIALYKKTRDVSLLGKLYDPYMSMVYGVCLKYLKNREESRDAVMQIFEKLVQTLLTHDVSNFRGWLYVTARNYCLMDLRSRKGIKFEDLSVGFMEDQAELHPEDGNESEAHYAKLEKCIQQLVAEQKECVSLFYLGQKCYKEITQMTGYDDLKVKSYIQNGKRNLKICMDKNG